MIDVTYRGPIKFIWDKGNVDKNWGKHKVTNKESEEVFFDNNKKIAQDIFHSKKEARYILLGKTKKGRLLYTVFTIRNKKIRVISSRDINRKEGELYEKAT